jgi:hypothetical protein
LPSMFNHLKQDKMFEHVGMIADVKGVTITEHAETFKKVN